MKNFVINLKIHVHNVDTEAEEYLTEDPLDFIDVNDLLDEASITVEEIDE